MTASRNKLSTWFADHGDNFLSYHIFSGEAAAISKSGVLLPEEQRLREEEKMVLPNKQIIDIEPIIKYLWDVGIRLPDRIKIISTQEIGLVQAFMQGLISENVYESCFSQSIKDREEKIINNRVTLTRRNREKIIITKDILNGESHIYGVGSNSKEASYNNLLNDLYQKFRVESYCIQLANDKLIEESIDERLAKIWDQRANSGVDKRVLIQHLLKLREDELSPNVLPARIVAAYNKVLWPYHCNVVVLFTVPEAMFSASNVPDFKARKEVCLLHPIENQGEALAINLKESNCLLIGPKEDLKIFAGSGLACLSIEELTDEERIRLEVPPRLRPRSPLIKLALFAGAPKVEPPETAAVPSFSLTT